MAAPTLQATVNLPSTGSWTATPYRASPISADIFGNGKDDLITVTAGAQLVAYATAANGSLTPVVTYQVPAGVADIKSTPIVVTDPSTGRQDLFAAMGRDEANSGTLEDGRVFGWDLETGQLLAGWASGKSTGVNVTGQTGAYGPLTTGDLQGNGQPDLVVTSFSHNVTAFTLSGTQLWQWTNDDTIVSGAVVGDIDRSGQVSVVVGGDSSNNGFYQAGGWVNVLSNTGVLKWRHFIPGEVTWATPTLADLDNNGYLDIVIGTGLNYATEGVAGAQAAGNYLYALDPFGNVLPGWPYHLTSNDAVAHEVLASVAVADLLGNGQLDVVAIDRAGYLHAIEPNGTDVPGFAGGIDIALGLPATSVPDDYASPIIADINGDGKPDIIAAAGPYLRAYNSSGTMIWSVSNPQKGTIPDGTDAAAVVNNMNGGSTGTLAYVTYNPNDLNRPDELLVYSLPATILAPPWPMQRRTAAGDAVMRSATYDAEYVAQAFQAATGGQPSAATLAMYDSLLNSDTFNLTDTAAAIFRSPAARAYNVTKVYEDLLGHAPTAAAITSWSTYLATNTIENMDLLLINGPEFAGLAGNTKAGEIGRLYTTVLGRAASASEINAWLATGENLPSIAIYFYNSPEGTNATINAMATAIYGAAGPTNLTADSRAAMAYDYHRGSREEDLMTLLLADGGNYAAANIEASYTEDLYRDILHRDPAASEVANWVTQMDTGAITMTQLPAILLNSQESRADVVNAEFETLLGRVADPSALASLTNYSSREALILTIMSSAEFYTHVGGTPTAYIEAVSNDLAAISPVPASFLSSWVAQFKAGTPMITLAVDLMTNPELYDEQNAVEQIMQYLPDESLGVLRSGNLSPTAAGQPINPSPTLIASLVSAYEAGASDETVIASLLTSPTYLSRVTYFKGVYRSPGIRN